MFLPRTKIRSAAVAVTTAAALIGLGAGAAGAAGWPPLQEGGHLYAGSNGTGTVTTVDLDDFGTCHTLSEPSLSIQVVSGSSSVVIYSEAGCTGHAWGSGSLAQSDLPWAALSYRVVPA
ncbi:MULTISPECIES: hypothetical protein [Streptomyces]|uniref:hypothetical protein n=1 Tax=Streptomyces TaxID=1883 RepID=UPI00167239D9|nr:MULTISPECIES: hypothetical protein [Streptomyces]MBK3526186.1 hypothetical protein [Streptomyces sp. MBT70]GGR57593.1 hypothetical protein GCM10010236_07270 [Streptomyces eurythermus]